MCRIGMARVDDGVKSFGHENRGRPQQRCRGLAQPSISPSLREIRTRNPIRWKLADFDPQGSKRVRYFDLEEMETIERLRTADGSVHEDFEQCSRRIRSAIENLVASRVPAPRGEEPAAPVQRGMLREPPQNHLRDEPVLDAEEDLLDGARASFTREDLKR